MAVALKRLVTLPAGVRIAFLLLAFAACWLVVLEATSLVPPVDNLEELVWQRALNWGYYKHPPLPTAIAWMAVGLWGNSAWTTYLLGAATTLAGMAVMWSLLRRLRGEQYANIALLGALCVTFYNNRLYYFNHNVVLLLLSAITALLVWRAFDERRMGWWVAIGVVLGLGALTKYQVAVTAVSLAVFWTYQRGWRDPLHRTGALLALLISLTIFTPHIVWLREHDFAPISYAMGSSLGIHLSPLARVFDAFNWIADELLNRAVPALLLLGVCWYSVRRRVEPEAPTPFEHQRIRLRSSRALLVIWGGVPLLFMPVVGLLFGANLQLQWGTPFLLFIVPCAMELCTAAKWTQVSQWLAFKAFAVLQVVLVLINVATSPFGLRSLVDEHWRTFGAANLTARVLTAARGQLHGPVAVVIGPIAEAGALSLFMPEHPAVLVDGRYDRSPWVTPELVAACGALELIHSKGPVNGASAVGPPFSDLHWRVVVPRTDAGPCRLPRQGSR